MVCTDPQVTVRYSTGESDHPPAAHDFKPGELPNIKPVKGQIGPYSLVCELGSGGMGTVFVAKRTLPGGVVSTVALKTLKSRSLPRPNLVEMFIDEVKIIARITHPYVCSVRDLGVAEGVPYVAMDYLVGEPLSRVIPVLASPPDMNSVACSTRLIADLCEGLHAAHELRDESGKLIDVVHRDVSPDNLFVLYDGTVRVVDFGIACTAELQKQGKTKVLAGKCAYMSPEQLRTKELDRRSDVWSMGVVLWEMLTGRRLFHRQSDLRTAVAVLEGPLEPPSRHNPHVPSALDDVVMHALSREPQKRPASARELARELESVLANAFGPVTASRLGNWLGRLFPGSYEFRRRIVTIAEAALKSAEVMAVSPESLRTRELDSDLMASIEGARARGTAEKTGAEPEGTTNPPVTLLRAENSQRLAPLGQLAAPEPLTPAVTPEGAKSLITEWLDEQSRPIFSKEPLEGFERKRATTPLASAKTASPPLAVEASSVSQVSPLPDAALDELPRSLSRKLVLGSTLLGVLTLAVVWVAWPKEIRETPPRPTVASTNTPEPTQALSAAAQPTQPVQPTVPEPATIDPTAPSALAAAPLGPTAAEPAATDPTAAAPSEPAATPQAEPTPSAPATEGMLAVSEPTATAAPVEPAAQAAKPAVTPARAPRPRAQPAAPAPSGQGKLYVMSREPDVTVMFSGKPLRLPAMLSLPAGPQMLLLQRGGQPAPGRKVDVKAGAVTMFSLD